ncbi:hypothetical protein E2C01_017636 [Portunus trituberculatus]|uniref:Uncharacterized protein n=1 Tax=Portunus trituberculatus TaxID=210409 RepID=A0A5B7DUA3_PORTR|nr:hypothetical protein [Portunus trituberculatus]
MNAWKKSRPAVPGLTTLQVVREGGGSWLSSCVVPEPVAVPSKHFWSRTGLVTLIGTPGIYTATLNPSLR